MKTTKKIIRIGIAGLVLACGPVFPAFSGDGNEYLPAAEILKRVQQKYASLSSYSDMGTIVSETDGGRAQTGTFRIKLGRPNFYWIEWEQAMPVRTGIATNRNVIWSAGDGEYCSLTGFSKYYKMPETLRAGTLYSPMPEMFFKATEGGGFWQMSAQPSNIARDIDERINGVDCRVLKGKVNDAAVKLWIGKDDFLIYRIQRVKEGVSAFGQNVKITDSMVAEALKRANQPITSETTARMKQELQASAVQAQSLDRRVVRRTTTETHERISVNEKFSSSNFAYQVPAGISFSETFP